jgi:hypothetical protein
MYLSSFRWFTTTKMGRARKGSLTVRWSSEDFSTPLRQRRQTQRQLPRCLPPPNPLPSPHRRRERSRPKPHRCRPLLSPLSPPRSLPTDQHSQPLIRHQSPPLPLHQHRHSPRPHRPSRKRRPLPMQHRCNPLHLPRNPQAHAFRLRRWSMTRPSRWC